MAARTSLIPDERVISEVKRIAHSGLEGLDLLQQVARALRRAVPFDASCATTTDPVTNLITDSVAERETTDPAIGQEITSNYYSRIYLEHDYEKTLLMLRESRTVALLSESGAAAREQDGRFRNHLQPRGLGHEIYSTFVDHGLWGELHLSRASDGPDFTEREAEIVRRIVPHVGAGLKAAALRTRMVIDSTENVPGVLMLDHAGRVMTTTPSAERLLSELGPLDPLWRSGAGLPVAVQVILSALDRTLTSAAGDHELPRLRARTRTGRWLTLHASLTQPLDGRVGERVVVVAPAQPEEIAWLSLASYGLSAREEEVVKLVVRGLSTKQIAQELYIAEYTVQRHLSNIFEKVGVRGRRMLVKQLFVEQMLPTLTPN